MKYRENMHGMVRVKMRGKIKYIGKDQRAADDWRNSEDWQAYSAGKSARARVEFHDGYRWEEYRGF